MSRGNRKCRYTKRILAAAALCAMSAWNALLPLPVQAQLLPSLPGGLVVTITAPAAGATVGGTTTVRASISPVGALVTGVQFELDGANLGAEDTQAPYTLAWNTTTAGNGAHTLTAVARDALGLRFTSAPVRVIVSNDATPPAVSITAPASGSTVAGTISVDAAASDNVGVAGVQFKLDGVNLGAEDTAAPFSVSWDTTHAADAAHRLEAVARDAAGNLSTSAPVTVTVLNAPPPPPPPSAVTRFEETHPSIVYTTGWNPGHTSRPWSGGTATFSATTGAQASFTFTGTAVSWIGLRGTVVGIARVFLDGAFVGEVDLYAPVEEVPAVVFSAADLAPGTHTLVIEVTGRKNPSATHVNIPIDAFDVTASSPPPAGAQVEETDASIAYTAGWTPGNTSRSWSGGTATVSATAGARATLSFTGASVRWIGFRGPVGGIARVSVDGVLVAEVDTYAAAEEVQAAVFAATGLAATSHTLTIEVTGLKNAAAADAFIVVDAFVVD